AAVQHRRPAFAEGDGRDIRQNAAIAPETAPRRAFGGAGDFLACRDAAQRREIVAHIECSGALRANGLRLLCGKLCPAARAFKVAYSRHFKTITAANRSGKFSPRAMKAVSCERTSPVLWRHVMMSPLSIQSTFCRMELCRRVRRTRDSFHWGLV